jgi:predicted metal-dependent hydrolase
MTDVSPYVVEWARLLETGDYFLSHETLEEHWVDAPKEDRDLLQGLIHLAVGFLHHTKGNAKGAKLQFDKASKRMEGYPDAHLGVDVAKAREFLRSVPDRLEAGETLQPPHLLIPVG